MEDRNHNKGSQSHKQNWDQNRNRNQDDQQHASNQGYSDLDGDGFIGNTGGFYGGTSYLGANYDDWNNNQSQDRSSDQYRNQGQQNRNQQEYGSNQYRGGQSYNQGGSYGNQSNQGMSGDRSNVRYGRGFDNYQDDTNRRQDNSHHNDSHHYGAGGSYNQYGGWGDNQISREQEQRADAYRKQLSQGYGNQGNNWNSGSNRSNYENRDQDRNWLDRATDKISSWFSDDNDRSNRGYQQQNMTGPHRGKGPRGYQRSADRIRDDIHDRLHDDPYVDASDIEIEVNQNEVILKGHVDSREAKRRAEDLVESISGVRHVENRLRIGNSDTQGNSNLYQNTSGRTGTKGTDDKDITI